MCLTDPLLSKQTHSPMCDGGSVLGRVAPGPPEPGQRAFAVRVDTGWGPGLPPKACGALAGASGFCVPTWEAGILISFWEPLQVSECGQVPQA